MTLVTKPARVGAALLLALSTLTACVDTAAIDRAVNNPERIEITPLADVTFDPTKTWVVFELASRSVRTGIQVFCDMQGTSSYRPRKTTWSGRCEDQRSFTVGTYDGSPFFSAVRTQLPDGTLLAVYEVETPLAGEFSPIAQSVNANFPLRIFIDRRRVYRFQPGAVHLLARAQTSEANLRQAFVNAFPATANRLAGQIVRTFQPTCDNNDQTPTCSVGAAIGVRAPVTIQQSRTGARTAPSAAQAPKPAAAPAPQAAVPGSPPLYEGSSYAAFTPEQINAYCAQDWTERAGPDGRTEYNPCKRRDAFR